jgi:hypothetical protein
VARPQADTVYSVSNLRHPEKTEEQIVRDLNELLSKGGMAYMIYVPELEPDTARGYAKANNPQLGKALRE